jgi:Helicase HerA, central domain
MSQHRIMYRITSVPDRTRSRHQAVSRGDPSGVINEGMRALLQFIADAGKGKIGITLRYYFDPAAGAENPQQRLVPHLVVRAKSSKLLRAAAFLIERRAMGHYYGLERVKTCDLPDMGRASVLHIVRKDHFYKPLVQRAVNPHVPGDHYYLVEPFQPREDNDFLDLDRLCAGLKERAVLDIAVEPTDICDVHRCHLRYLARTRAACQTWAHRDGDAFHLREFMTRDIHTPSPWDYLQDPVTPKDPVAEEILRRGERFQESLQLPHLAFSIRVASPDEAGAYALAQTLAGEAFLDGTYDIRPRPPDDDESVDTSGEPEAEGVPDATGCDGLSRLPNIATVDELAAVFRLPIAGSERTHCIRKDTDPPPLAGNRVLVLGHSVFDGPLDCTGGCLTLPRCIPLDLLTRHAFICGMNGSGKTNALKLILWQLIKQGINFVICDPAKRDYRFLKTLALDNDPAMQARLGNLRLFTVGNERVCPLRLAPFAMEPGESPDDRAEHLFAWLQGSLAMEAPLPEILRRTLYRTIYRAVDTGITPTMRDFAGEARRIFDGMGYSGEVRDNLRSALDTRLTTLTQGHLGRLLQCSEAVPGIGDLLRSQSVIEIDNLVSDSIGVSMLLLLMTIHQHIRYNPLPGQGLRFCLIFEEAHNVIGSTKEAEPSGDVVSPEAFASEYVSRMVAELRAYGVGVIIVDQKASLSPAVLREARTKFAFSLVEKEERDSIADAMLLDELGREELARLAPGQGFLFTQGYYRPELIQTPLFEKEIRR